MNLERLPNEILLDLFEYVNGIDLLRAFYGLNSRFNFLLYTLFRSYRFQFHSVSKRNFDMICKQHLPNIAPQVMTLRLTNYKETPEQINLFLTYVPTLRQFTHLRSLRLSYLHSYETLMEILNECQHLHSLTQLHIWFCNFSDSKIDLQLMINKIWSLPKLIHYYTSIGIDGQQAFYIPTIISKSIKFVTIYSAKLKLHQVNQLADFTPHLKSLRAPIQCDSNNDYLPSSLPTLIQLNIHLSSDLNIPRIILFLQNMPNLHHLNVRIYSKLIDGQQWEYIIHNYLSKLKIFQLQMKKFFFSNANIQEEADRLLNSFRSSFWIHERQWFVRCFTQNGTINLYTPSKRYHVYDSTHPISWKSTYSHQNQQEFYDNMTSIYDETFFDKPIPSDIRLSNIDYLCIKLPINDQFWSVMSDLRRLYSLTVSSFADNFQSQVQTLLDRASHLHSLTIKQDPSLPLQMSLFKYTSASIRKLYLRDCQHCFNEEECLLLSRSPLGIQCEVLSILVKNRESIIHLVKSIINLRSLTIQCEDEDNVELIQWLKDRLPLTYLIIKHPDSDKENTGLNILIWI